MKVTIKKSQEVSIKILRVNAKPLYWEYSAINGGEDTEDGEKVPCNSGGSWCPEIEIETGKILNWPQGTTAEICYKVCDCCGWEILDENDEVVLNKEGDYVPKTLCPKRSGYGDYIIMDIDENGVIQNWKFNIDDFIEE